MQPDAVLFDMLNTDIHNLSFIAWFAYKCLRVNLSQWNTTQNVRQLRVGDLEMFQR